MAFLWAKFLIDLNLRIIYSQKNKNMNLLAFIGLQELIVILLIVPVFLIIPIIALVDILKNEFTGNNKLIWVLVVLLSWIIGAILYFFIGRKQKIQN
jgi:hypothetical protein